MWGGCTVVRAGGALLPAWGLQGWRPEAGGARGGTPRGWRSGRCMLGKQQQQRGCMQASSWHACAPPSTRQVLACTCAAQPEPSAYPGEAHVGDFGESISG